jgi:sulfate adenylyltransferase
LRVLFVCTANICRSPFMELTARSIAGPDATVEFSSAGTHGSEGGLLYDEMSPHLADADAATAFRSRAFTAQLLEDADLVLTAEASHRAFILDDHPGAFRRVYTLGQFAEAVQAVDPQLSGRDLLAEVGRRRVTARADLDVTDPYRRGPEAARAAADRITELLRVVVPALTGSRKITS